MKTTANSVIRCCIIAMMCSMFVPLSFGDFGEGFVNANIELYQVDADIQNARIFMNSGRFDAELYPRQKHLRNKDISRLKIGFYDHTSKTLNQTWTLEEYCEMCTTRSG